MNRKLVRLALSAALLAAGSSAALAQYNPYETPGQHQVQGYTNQNGTYVQPHMQTNPDSSRTNNWSSQGNTNPYTGQAGTQNPYAATPNYGTGGAYGNGQRNYR